jgi:hypothetical protein
MDACIHSCIHMRAEMNLATLSMWAACVYPHTHTHKYMLYTPERTRAHACMHSCIYMFAHIEVHLDLLSMWAAMDLSGASQDSMQEARWDSCVYIYVCTYVCVCMYVCCSWYYTRVYHVYTSNFECQKTITGEMHIYIYIYIYTHTYIHKHTHTFTHGLLYVRICSGLNVEGSDFVERHADMPGHGYVRINILTRAHTCTHICTHTNIRMHTQTYAVKWRSSRNADMCIYSHTCVYAHTHIYK